MGKHYSEGGNYSSLQERRALVALTSEELAPNVNRVVMILDVAVDFRLHPLFGQTLTELRKQFFPGTDFYRVSKDIPTKDGVVFMTHVHTGTGVASPMNAFTSEEAIEKMTSHREALWARRRAYNAAVGQGEVFNPVLPPTNAEEDSSEVANQ